MIPLRRNSLASKWIKALFLGWAIVIAGVPVLRIGLWVDSIPEVILVASIVSGMISGIWGRLSVQQTQSLLQDEPKEQSRQWSYLSNSSPLLGAAATIPLILSLVFVLTSKSQIELPPPQRLPELYPPPVSGID